MQSTSPHEYRNLHRLVNIALGGPMASLPLQVELWELSIPAGRLRGNNEPEANHASRLIWQTICIDCLQLAVSVVVEISDMLFISMVVDIGDKACISHLDKVDQGIRLLLTLHFAYDPSNEYITCGVVLLPKDLLDHGIVLTVYISIQLH